MRVDGSTLAALLSLEFESVVRSREARSLQVDFPLLYDDACEETAGHIVLMPKGTQPCVTQSSAPGTIAICQDDETTRLAGEAGYAVVQVADPVPFGRIANIVQVQFEKLQRWEALLNELVDTYSGYQALLDACVDMWDYPCALIDRHYRAVFLAGDVDEDIDFRAELTEGTDSLMADAVDTLMASPEYRRLRRSHAPFPIPGSSHLIMLNIFADGQPIGALIVRHSGSSPSARVAHYLVEGLAQSVELLYGRTGSFGAAAAQPNLLRSALARVLDGQRVNVADIERMLVDAGHKENDRYVLVQLERSFTNEGKEGHGYLARRIEQMLAGTYCVTSGGFVYALANIDAHERDTGHSFWYNLPLVLREMLVKAGASRAFSSMSRLACARFQAGAALEQGLATEPTYWFYRFDDYAVPWILTHDAMQPPADYVAHEVFSVLAYHDAEQGSDLLHTLDVFLQSRYNATLAAKQLYVARSTLLNRLERIQELMPLDLEDLDTRLYLALSFKLYKR